MVGVGLNLFVHHSNRLYNPINSKAGEERRQERKKKHFRVNTKFIKRKSKLKARNQKRNLI
jgi:hypothetical protein